MAGLLTIILVAAAVGLVVFGHQPRNPIGWLLADEATRSPKFYDVRRYYTLFVLIVP